MKKEIELDVLLRGRKFKKMIEQIYRNLRVQYDLKQVEVEVLLYLGLMPDISSTELASELALQKGHVSVAMFALCEKGYLRSEQSRKDRRMVHFHITEKGEKVRREIEQIKHKVNEQILKDFTEEEVATLESLTRKLLNNVEQFSC